METNWNNRRSPSDKDFRRPNQNAVRPVNGQYKPRFNQRPNQPQPPRKAFFDAPPDVVITNDLQVTDGRHKGIQLIHTASPKVRPTERLVREVLFRTLARRVRFARFLDLCAGSGAVGVEAISRGALLSTFVERSAKMCHFIRQNLHVCKICPTGHGEVHQIEVSPFLKKMTKRKRCWDIVFYNPPFNTDYEEVLDFFGRGKCLRETGGVLVIEHHAEMFFPIELNKLIRRKVVVEGDTALTFYERVK